MTYAPRPADFHRDITTCRAPAAATPRHGWLGRLFDAMLETRRRDAQRAVDAYVARSGGRLTDSIEREIGERLINGGWDTRR